MLLLRVNRAARAFMDSAYWTEEEWKDAQDKAIHFAEMNLNCCFGVAPEAASRMVQVIVLEGQMDI